MAEMPARCLSTPADGHSGCFQCLTLWVMLPWICIHVFGWTCHFLFLGSVPRSGTIRSWSKYWFKFYKNYQAFSKWCAIFCAPHRPECIRVPTAPHLHQHLKWSVFLSAVMVRGVEWHLILVLTCIFSLTPHSKHLLRWSICVCSLVNFLFQALVHFPLGCLYHSVVGILPIYWIQVLDRIYDLQIFPSSPWLVFLFS